MNEDEEKVELSSCVVTVFFVATNILVYLITEIRGDTQDAAYIFSCGGLWPDSVLYDGQGWRLFSCLFLHFGPTHLVNNMVLLFLLGREAEKAAGHVSFALVYILSGLTGSAASLVTMVRSGDEAVCAGASGAIFGIMGLLIVVLLVHRGHYERFTIRRMLLMVALCLYFGFSSAGVDNAGHVGGLCGGLVWGFIFYGIPHAIRSRHGSRS